jgi:hypothetical protein
MPPISTPETEHAFKLYGSALEVKEAAKASLVVLEEASRLGRDLEPTLREELESTIGHVKHLLGSATEAVARLRPIKIEDRGYSAHDRGLGAFAKDCGCDDSCSGKGSGGCGGCKP